MSESGEWLGFRRSADENTPEMGGLPSAMSCERCEQLERELRAEQDNGRQSQIRADAERDSRENAERRCEQLEAALKLARADEKAARELLAEPTLSAKMVQRAIAAEKRCEQLKTALENVLDSIPPRHSHEHEVDAFERAVEEARVLLAPEGDQQRDMMEHGLAP